MEMHQAMMEEVMHLGNSDREDMSWEDANLLAGAHTALENLFGLYRDVHVSLSPPPGTYGDTPLMRA